MSAQLPPNDYYEVTLGVGLVGVGAAGLAWLAL
jgi:hypothetical protein